MLAGANATRMELLYLRRRVSLAQRGHRLLSEKRDELSRSLVRIARDIKPLRRQVEEELRETFMRFILARAAMEPEDINAALEAPTKTFGLEIKFAAIMNVKVPHLIRQTAGEIICYGFATTSGELDVALMALEKVFDRLIELAEKEKQARLLALELRMTRRKVNVLEHVIIPRMKETIKFIFDKLSEIERDSTSRLMKIADIIRS
jgi:V/A-type H+-transporting ATPase subunit D